jgi:predicted component of type VI protein secretion system
VIQLHILSGRQAGGEFVVRRFPFLIGRAGAHLPLEDAGVWERHLQIDFPRGEGFTFTTQSEAGVILNGTPAAAGLLRNGDLLELGAARLRVWLTRTRQPGLRWCESLIWISLLALMAAQAALVWWLLR